MKSSISQVLTLIAALAIGGVSAAPAAASAATPASPTASDPADVYKAQATAKTRSPTSHVKGKSFDRYVSIWFENTDYDMAAADPNFQFFAQKGLTLENLFAVTHPSEPNYISAIGGDYFGLDGDAFNAVPQNVSSVVDLLEERGISWGLYQEDLPYTGYQGFDWVNQVTGANDYVRKHNPAVMYNSVATKPERLELIKNTTLFFEDLANDRLPQWMFITPNMTSDGHDTSVTVAGAWLANFLKPLLDNPSFMSNTLVLITFDENETYSNQNRVFSVLLGDALPEHLIGATDASYYDHYSEIATVEANWDLHTLGRFDVGANVFAHVARETGDEVREWTGHEQFFNQSYPGIFAGETAGDLWAPQPVPNVTLEVNGRRVQPAIVAQWEGKAHSTYYKGQLENPDGLNPPVNLAY